MTRVNRPWGFFDILYQDETTWFKKLTILPGQSLSYQYHLHRDEFWVALTDGAAVIDDIKIKLRPTDLVHCVAAHTKHRLYNPGHAAFVVLEWATGRPDEEDIVRLEDMYNR